MRIRTEIFIGFILTIICLAIGYSEYTGISKALSPSTPQGVQPTTTSSNGTTQSDTISLTPTEIAKHNTSADCWLVMDQNVYNATNYLRLHPGGANRISPYCGKDATAAYTNQGHSGAAAQQKAMLQIGTLNGTTDTTTIQNVEQKITQQAPPPGRREFEDEDDD